jgi:hypothetical protein
VIITVLDVVIDTDILDRKRDVSILSWVPDINDKSPSIKQLVYYLKYNPKFSSDIILDLEENYNDIANILSLIC